MTLQGFRLANDGVRPRLVISVKGLEKQGKTHFSLTAPAPIAYLNFDIGDEGVRQKFQTQKQIYIPVSPYQIRFDGKSPKDTQAKAEKEWERFYADYQRTLLHCRTVVVDTATEAWELLRLARFGRLTQIMPHHYVEVNEEYRDFIRDAYEHEANLILLHKMKAEWVNDASGKGQRTGRYERAGFSDTGFLVQANLWAYRLPPHEREAGDLGFRMLVEDCRQNAELSGLEMRNDEITFSYFAWRVYPDLDPSVWE